MIPMPPPAAATDAPRLALNVWHGPLALQFVDPDAADPPPLTVEVLPPPTAEGMLPTRDGRDWTIAGDMAQLAAAVNVQPVGVRVDFDHQSEPISPTFGDSTAARGWAVHFRVNAHGGLDADLDLQPGTVDALRAGTYKYLSPVIRFDRTQRVTGLSSISLVNNPNLPLAAPALNSEQTMTDTDTTTQTQPAAQLAAREAAITQREHAADQLLLNAATHAVDQAIAAGQILPAHRDFHLTTIQAHTDGIEAGLNAFTAFIGAAAETDGGVDLHALGARTLQTRVGPRGAPRAPAAPAVPLPAGYQPAEDQLALHAKIADHAKARGIAFRDAALEFGALTGI